VATYTQYYNLKKPESTDTTEIIADLNGNYDDIDTYLYQKADKVPGAVAGNFASLDATGNLQDSGYSASSFASVTHTTDIDPHFQFAYTTDMTYDTSGNLVQVDYLVGGVLRKRETYNYDTNGNLTSINTKVYDADGTMVLVEYNDNFAYVGDDLDYIERVMA
jgi:hypothetical protein